MDIDINRLSAILFSSTKNVEFIHQLNQALRYMIERDSQYVASERSAPQIWECKWLNQPNVYGYPKGYTVWINTMTYDQLLGANRQVIESYVTNNPLLNMRYNQISLTDSAARNKFLINAMKGQADPSVSAIYCLGDIQQKAQIRVSTIDNNKAYPTDLCCWEDFFVYQSYDENVNMLLSAARDSMNDVVNEHISSYHRIGMNEITLRSEGYFKKDPFSLEDVQTQNFFDHSHCNEMRGFDFVKRWKMLADGSAWCKIWNSGYIEQGGFVDNIPGEALIPVDFMTTYNYPLGASFYQRDYTTYAGQYHINNSLQANNRYVVTVTPVMDSDSQPYPDHPVNIANELVYSSVDMTNMSNTGFSIVNTDMERNRYSKYSWHACGYKVLTADSQMFDGIPSVKTTTDSTPFVITAAGMLQAFNDNEYVVVKVPENVVSISDRVFEGNTYMRSIILPSGLEDIGISSFAGCQSLKGVSLPKNITSVPEYAFYNCNELVYMKISENANFIGTRAFSNDSNFSTFNRFADNDPSHTFDKVGDYAFSSTAFKTLNLSLRSAGIDNFWGDYCFANCNNLEEVNILSACYMSNGMFSNCKKLKTVNFKNNQTSYVYPNVFDGCSSLTGITLPSKIWYISEEMFKDCSSLKYVKFNDYDASNAAINLVQRNAFNGCSNLQSLELPASLTSLDQLDDACLCGCALTSITFHGISKSGIIEDNGEFKYTILSSGMFRLQHNCNVICKDGETLNYVYNPYDLVEYSQPTNYLTAVNTTITSNFKTAKQCIDASYSYWWYYNASQLYAQANDRATPCLFIYSLLGCKPCQVYMNKIFNNANFQNWAKKQKFYLCGMEVDKQPYYNQQLKFCVEQLVPNAQNFAKEDMGQSEKDVIPNALGNIYRRWRVDSGLLNSNLTTPVLMFYYNNGSRTKSFVHSFHNIDREIDSWGVDGVIQCLKSLCLYYFDNNNLNSPSFVVDAVKEFDIDDYRINSESQSDDKYVVIPTTTDGRVLTTTQDVNSYIAQCVGPDCTSNGTPYLMNCGFLDVPFLINTFEGIDSYTTIADVNSFLQRGENARYSFKIGEKYYKFSLSTTNTMPVPTCIVGMSTAVGGAPVWTLTENPG